MATLFTYSISGDTLNGAVAIDKLKDEIRADVTITIALSTITIDGNDLDITFKANLATPEETALDAVVAAHDGNPGLDDARRAQLVGPNLDAVSVVDDAGTKRLAVDFKDPNSVQAADFISTSSGVSDADKPVKTDAGGQMDGSLINEANDEFTVVNTGPGASLIIDTSNPPFDGTTFRKDNASGFLNWFPNAGTTQFLCSDPNAATGTNQMYFDVDNEGTMFIQVLPGAGRTGDLVATHNGRLIPNEDLTSKLGDTANRWEEVHAQTYYGDGSNLTGISFVQEFTATAFGNINDRDLVEIRGTDVVQQHSGGGGGSLPPIGFADGAISNGASGTIRYEGILDGFTGLTAGFPYYRDNTTNGAITSTKPTSGPVYMVGVAKSPTELHIEFRDFTSENFKNNALAVGNIGSASNAANQNFQIDLSAYGFEIGDTVRLCNSYIRGDLSDDSSEYLDIGFGTSGAPKVRLGDVGYDDLAKFRTDGGFIDQTETVVDIGGGTPGLQVYVSPASAVNFSPSGMPNGWYWQFKIDIAVI